MSTVESTLTVSQFADALRELGLARGDSVLLHSSFRSLAPFAGTPVDVVRAVLDVVGSAGHVMLPTFNYSAVLPEPYFDVAQTPARTGAIAELGRRLPGAVRSLHPTHSVTVIGPDAARLSDAHLCGRAFGVGSPIDRLAQQGGKVLLLGVGHTANSTIHVAEEHAGIPKAPRREPLPCAKVRLPDGRVVLHQLDSSPSCSAGFDGAACLLRCRGLIRDGLVNQALLQLMLGRDLIRCVADALAVQPDLLLCTNPRCICCTGTRDRLRRRGDHPLIPQRGGDVSDANDADH